MQFLVEYGLFLAKAITLVTAILIVAGGLAALAHRQKKSGEQHLEITHLNQQYDQMERALCGALLSPQQLKQKLKAEKKADKAKAKADKKATKMAAKKTDKQADDKAGDKAEEKAGDKAEEKADDKADKKADEKAEEKAEDAGNRPGKCIYVLNFDGDIQASAVASFRQEISAILTVADAEDEVVVRLESAGGVVHGYGLAASQLRRIRDRKIPLTVCVDKVAASGGYLMACVADKIIAAPFAIIGSIGVLAQIPNLYRLLKKHEVDFEQLYAGEYKRTLTLFGENTDEGRVKMQQQLEEIHDQFKEHIKSQRPAIDIDKVATGEHWLGSRALELGLVDQLQTSDDYLMESRRDAQLVLVSYTGKKKLMERLASLTRLHWPWPGKSADGLDQPMLL